MTSLVIIAWIFLSNAYELSIIEHSLLAVSNCIAFAFDILFLATQIIKKKKDE